MCERNKSKPTALRMKKTLLSQRFILLEHDYCSLLLQHLTSPKICVRDTRAAECVSHKRHIIPTMPTLRMTAASSFLQNHSEEAQLLLQVSVLPFKWH